MVVDHLLLQVIPQDFMQDPPHPKAPFPWVGSSRTGAEHPPQVFQGVIGILVAFILLLLHLHQFVQLLHQLRFILQTVLVLRVSVHKCAAQELRNISIFLPL